MKTDGSQMLYEQEAKTNKTSFFLSRNCRYHSVCLTFIMFYTDCTHHQDFQDSEHTASNLTLFIIVAYDGVLEDIRQGEADGVFLALAAERFVCTLFLQGLFTLVVCTQLITTHPPHQPLPLPER